MERECGSCTVCCYIGGVPELHKPSHRECKYQGNGCSIYGDSSRPTLCSNFQCRWLVGLGSEEDRPDKSKVMVTVNTMNGGTWVYVIELEKGATTGKGRSIILEAIKESVIPVIVVDYESLPPNDFGDRVIIKKELMGRSKKLRGDFKGWFENGIGIYDLVVN